MRRLVIFAVLAVTILILTGCTPPASYSASMPTPRPVEQIPSPASIPTSAAVAMLAPTAAAPLSAAPGDAPQSGDTAGSLRGGIGATPGSNGQDANVGQKRVVLKNATLSLTVDDPASVVNRVTQIAENMNGWVVNSNTVAAQQNGHTITQANISIRVPAEQLDSVLEQIKAMAYSVDSEVITGDDVSQKYVDLSSQLTNLQNTEAQLQKIMATATNVQDVLAVQNQLTNVQGQIEQIKGQLQYFDQAAAYSLITLTLTPKPIPATPTSTPTITPSPTITPTPTAKPFGLQEWHPEGVALSAVDTLVALVQVVITFAIWLVILGLPIGIFLLIGLFIWRRLPHPKPVSVKPPQETPPD